MVEVNRSKVLAEDPASHTVPEGMMECAICFCTYDLKNKRPINLHCDHTYCKECLNKIADSEGVQTEVKNLSFIFLWILNFKIPRSFSLEKGLNAPCADKIA